MDVGSFVVIQDVSGENLKKVKTIYPPFYYYWSPNSRYVAWLSNSKNLITFQIIDVFFIFLFYFFYFFLKIIVKNYKINKKDNKRNP